VRHHHTLAPVNCTRVKRTEYEMCYQTKQTA
jgi:hypothetical protein